MIGRLSWKSGVSKPEPLRYIAFFRIGKCIRIQNLLSGVIEVYRDMVRTLLANAAVVRSEPEPFTPRTDASLEHIHAPGGFVLGEPASDTGPTPDDELLVPEFLKMMGTCTLTWAGF